MSKDKKRLVPVRRFKEFENAPAWEQRKLGEVVEITMGQSPSSKNYTENPNDHILVQGNADMKNGHVVPRVWTTQITKQAEKGDLILSVRAPVGDIGKTDYDVVLGRGVAAIKGNSFIFQLLTKMKINGYWTRFSTGSTFESINSDNIKNAQISIPSLREQEKIGGLFNEFDSLIALHQRKLDKLKRVKSAYLTEMFPAEGEREPKRRFPGFTVAWEQRKLGEITKTHSFKQYISEAFDHGKYMVIQQGENPIAGYANGDPFENFKDVTLFGDHTLSLFKPQEKFFVASDGIKILSPSLKMNGMFYYYLLEKYRPQSEGYKRHFTIMKKSTALFPIEIDEQIKISNFLEELDSLIALHQCKLDKLKKMKAAYLEEMFV